MDVASRSVTAGRIGKRRSQIPRDRGKKKLLKNSSADVDPYSEG